MVQGLGFGVEGLELGFRDWGKGWWLVVDDLGFRYRVNGLALRDKGLGFRVEGLVLKGLGFEI